MQAEQLLRELADELWQAEHTGVPAEPLTKRHPSLEIEDAYAIQSINIDRHVAQGARICGRKVGLTSLPMQELLGVDEPDYGVLLDHMFVEDGDEVARPDGPRADPGGNHFLESGRLPARRTATNADDAVAVIDARVLARAVRIVGAGPAERLPCVPEVENHGRGHDGNRSHVADRKSALALAQPAHHAVRGAESKSRTTAEEDRVDPLDEVTRIHHVELARARGPTPQPCRGAHALLRSEHDGASGAVRFDRRVADDDAVYGGEVHA